MSRRTRHLSAQESALFRLTMRDVEPLAPEAMPVTDAAPTPAGTPAAKKTVLKKPVSASRLATKSVRPVSRNPQSPEALIPESRPTPGIDRRTDQRLGRGRMEIEATLDLHGMNRMDAAVAFAGFVRRAIGAGMRCVLVVTGKGTRAPDGGVLRRALGDWINSADLRSHILSVKPAQPQHGGGGAFYVLLRRERERDR